MRIVVCIKHVPDTAEVRIDQERGTLIREGVPGILNPLDAHAVEAAVRLKDELSARTTALTMGPPQAEEALREALAHGCDEGVLLTDPAFAGADTLSTSYTLACAIRQMGDVDLVLCGKQAIDGDTAQVGPGIAAHLGWPQLTYARRITSLGGGTIEVERMTDYGNETIRAKLPAVVTALKDLNVPRLPSLVSRMSARRAEIQRRGAGDVEGERSMFGLDGSPTHVVRVFTPPPRGECAIFDGEPEQAAADLIRALKERRII